jgi:hypothetical protein
MAILVDPHPSLLAFRLVRVVEVRVELVVMPQHFEGQVTEEPELSLISPAPKSGTPVVVLEHHVALARVGRPRFRIQLPAASAAVAMVEMIRRAKPGRTTAAAVVVVRRAAAAALAARESWYCGTAFPLLRINLILTHQATRECHQRMTSRSILRQPSLLLG